MRELINEPAGFPSNALPNRNEAGTRRVLFQLQKSTGPASCMYFVGSIPDLREWRLEHPCSMTQHSGLRGCWRGERRLHLEIDGQSDEIQHRYMIVSNSRVADPRGATLIEPLCALKIFATRRRYIFRSNRT